MSTKTETTQPTVLASGSGRYVVASLTAEFEHFSLLTEAGKKLAAQYEIAAPVIVVTPLAEQFREAQGQAEEETKSSWLYLISITSRLPAR